MTEKLLNSRDLDQVVDQEMNAKLAEGIPEWTPQQKLAISCRILAANGHTSGLAGQISVRAKPEESNGMWTQTFGLGMEEAKASNMVCVDDQLKVVIGKGMPNPANRFHLWVYKKRPEINSIIHTHATYTSALAMIGQPLVISHMDTMALYEDCAYLADWPGVPNGDEEGEIISNGLGNKRCILLAHHGLLTTGKTVEEALGLAVTFEKAAKLHMIASSVGPIKAVKPHLGEYAHKWKKKQSLINGYFAYHARSILTNQADCLD